MNALRACLIGLALLATACGRPAAPPVTLHFQVDGMHCDGCVQAITDKVTHLEGVSSCSVSLQERRADISVRDAAMAPTVRQAIERLGYRVTTLQGGATASAPGG